MNKNNLYLQKNTAMKSIINLLAICLFAFVNAHTVWIETELGGKVNKKHEIKVFFGEIEKPTPTAKWFSDIKDLELRIISPSGKVSVIKEKTQQENYYSSFFTPMEKGVYTISVKHLVKDTFKKMKITYHSVAFMSTDASNNHVKMGVSPLEMVVEHPQHKLNKENKLQFLFNGEAKSKHKVKIVSDNGWEQNVMTNVKGEVKFEPLWKGKYLVEFVNSQKEEGLHNEQPFNTDYQMWTYYVHVK